MSFILVTNDDGVKSPALVPLMQALAPLAPVRAVVPDRERSWIGKAITRWEDVRVARADRDGCAIWTATGYPADCTQLGVHSLFDERPDMVVSGINVGFNHGLAFLLSSGTVGAAAEGWLADLPAIAFSTGVVQDHALWAQEAWGEESGPLWRRAAALAADVVRGIRERGFPDGADVLSVNFPAEADVSTPRVVTRIAHVAYDQLFQRRAEGHFVHDFGGAFRRRAGLDGTDVGAAREGKVSITPVRLAHTAELAAAEKAALERG